MPTFRSWSSRPTALRGPGRMLAGAPCLLLLATLAGCSGVKVASSYEDPAQQAPVQRLLVLLPALEFGPHQHELAQDAVRRELAAVGFDVLTREAYFDPAASLASGRLEQDLASADAVLALFPGRILMSTRGEQSFMDTRLGYINFEDEITQLFASGGRLGPEIRGDDTRKELEVHLFPVATGRLAWERRLVFSNPGSWLDVIEQGAPRIASALARAGYVAGT